jgi:hypothetical protein
MKKKKEKIFIIPFTHTISYPNAMMVKPFNAIIALGTMTGPGRSVNIASIAKIKFKHVSLSP